MKKKTKTVFVIIAVGLVVALYVTATRSAKTFLERQLSSALQEKVSLQAVHIAFPAGIAISGVAGSSFSIQQVGVHFDFSALMRGRPGLDVEVTNPKISLERSADGQIKLPVAAAQSSAEKRKPSVFLVARLRVRGGEVTFRDEQVNPAVNWLVRDLRVSVKQGRTPGSIAFGVIGELQHVPQKPVGAFEVKGEWLIDQTGEADVTLRHDALEELAPYVRPILGSSPASGKFELSSKVTLHQGMVLADNKLKVTGLSFATNEPTILGPAGSRLVELLQDQNGEIHLAFVVKGKLGERLDWSDAINSTLREAMRRALARGIQDTLSGIESKHSLEDLIKKGLESIGR